jgi:methylmalonyl-CoA mutase
VPVLKVDNAVVRAAQLAKLVRLKAERDTAAVEEALHALRQAAQAPASPALSSNLLALAVVAARQRATVGEMSSALEQAWGRHKAEPRVLTGVYGKAIGAHNTAAEKVRGLTRAFREDEGRAPKILVAKMGQDGHDRGQKVIASAFSDLGFDVAIGELFATPEEVAERALDAQAHVIGVSSLAAGHLALLPALKAALAEKGRSDLMVVIGGVIPPEDVETLLDMGAAAVFPPGTNIPEAAAQLLDDLNGRLGYAQRQAAQ